MMKQSNLKKIAELAGCSISTVSRALNDSPLISDRTKLKVKEVADKIDYHPNINATALFTNKTNNIGIILLRSVMQSFANAFFSDLFRGINEVAVRNGFFTLNCYYDMADPNLDFGKQIRSLVKSHRIDGALILSSISNNAHIKIFNDNEFPFVMLGKPLTDTNFWIDNDNYDAAFKITDYLFERGYKKPVFISGPSNFSVCHERFRGFLKAYGKYHDVEKLQRIVSGGIDGFISLEKDLGDDLKNPINFSTFDTRGARNSAKYLIDHMDLYDSAVVIDDLNAFSILQYLKEKGVSIPRDFGVAAFNNSYFSKLSSPSITTVETFPAQLGQGMTTHLIDLIQDKDHKILNHIIPSEIIKGGSTQ